MRHGHALVVLLVVLALLSGCGFGGGPPETTVDVTAVPDASAGPEAGGATPVPDATPVADGVMTIGFGAQEFERQVFEPLIATFNQQNPGIRVQFVSLDEAIRPVPGEAFDPGLMVRKIVSAADTAAVFFIRPEDMKNGLLHDLKPLIDADADFNADDYYPGVFDPASLNGASYMLPRTIHIQLMSYNKDLWAARGLPAPKPDWTWRDVLGAAEQLAQKRGSEVDVYGLLDWGSGYMALFNELAASGVDLFATPADQLRLDRPEIATALERVATLAKSGALYYKPQDPNGLVMGDDFRKLIVEQRAAMWPRDMLFAGPGGEEPAFPIGVAPMPASPLPFFGGSEGYVMSSGTQYPQAAWRWLSFLSRQQIKSPFEQQDGIGQLPARKSLAENSGYWSNLDQEAAAAVRAVVERPAAPLPERDFNAQFLEPLGKALAAVVSGKQLADQALREAQATLDKQLAQAQTTPTAVPASGPIVVATPQVEIVPDGAAVVSFGVFQWQADQVRPIARKFNQNNPEIFVQIKNIDMGGSPPSLAGAAAASDCFMWWGPPGKEEITATLDLQPLLDADPAFSIDDYPALLLAPFRQESGLYGLPHEVTFRVLSYNKDAFDAAGLSYPTADWTLNDLLNAAQKLTTGSDESKQYGYATDGPLTEDLLFFMNRFGAAPTQGSGDAVKPNYTDAKVIEAVRFYVDLLRDYSPHKEFKGYKTGEMFGGELFGLIREGRVGMSFDFGNTFFFVGPGEQPKYTRAIAPPPLGEGPLAAEDVRSNGLFISASTQQAQACWQWLKHLSGDPSELARQGSFPARSSVAQSEAFLGAASSGAAEVYKAYRTAFERTSGQSPREPFYGSQLDYFWFFRAVDRALQGKNLERELADAQALSEQYLTCVRGEKNPGGCAKQVEPTYEGWNSAPAQEN
jgi:ABC-type glycerol-3-phosphate transport system substrate-binding protein